MNSTTQQQIKTHLEKVQKIKEEIQKVIVGQDDIIRHVLIALFAGGHVLLEGVPGLGKTMLIRTLGEVLDLHFSRIQFTPDMMPADIMGTEILTEIDNQRVFHFQPGPIFANLVLADEINRAPPKTQSAMLEAMQEQTVTIAKHTYPLESPFFVMATQNPLEMDGTYPLPEAQLDRFFFKIVIDYPSETSLSEIFKRTTGEMVHAAAQVAHADEVIEISDIARQVVVASHVNEYVARLITHSHPKNEQAPPLVKKYIRYGASPRGGQSIILGAKVNALLEGRFNVAFEDVRTVTHAALRHRMLLNFEGLAEEIDSNLIISEILDSIPLDI
ncbi:MAG: AAA family ATPase [Anaerolineae bacterium]|nr:AAA family ATPase [Anaerolineae bacterium]